MGFNHKNKVQTNLQPIQQPPSPAQQLPTPVNIRRRLPFLSGYDHSIVQLLESGFTSGFPMHFDGPRCFQGFSLGLVPKKVEIEFRLIHHLSFPRGLSLDEGISLDYTTI